MGKFKKIEITQEGMNRWIERMNDIYISNRTKFIIAADGKMFMPKGDGKPRALNDRYMFNHMIGKFAVAIYAGENASKFMCFDVDDGNPDSVRAIMGYLERCGIDRRFICVSSSGGKGYHVEVFFDRLVSTWMQKRVYAWVIAETGLDRHKIEFRPTSRQAIKLPLCVHHKTGNICWYLDAETLEPIESQEFVMSIERMSADDFL